MQDLINYDVLATMEPLEFEDWRNAGEDMRSTVTHAVMRYLDCPAGWDVNGEYRSEFGGFFPVQIRFTPSHNRYHLAVCSPGELSCAWTVIFIPASGRPFSVVRTLAVWSPEIISHTLSLTARLDADGYNEAGIISLLSMEGAV